MGIEQHAVQDYRRSRQVDRSHSAESPAQAHGGRPAKAAGPPEPAAPPKPFSKIRQVAYHSREVPALLEAGQIRLDARRRVDAEMSNRTSTQCSGFLADSHNSPNQTPDLARNRAIKQLVSGRGRVCRRRPRSSSSLLPRGRLGSRQFPKSSVRIRTPDPSHRPVLTGCHI